MKKFLSICLVALCSVSAMYAETTPTPDEAKLDEVECGSTVKVSATAANKHFHFDHWVITGFNNNGTTSETINKGETSSIFTTTSNSTTTGQDNDIEKEELTVTINSSLINLVNTTPSVTGTLTFEAFFTEDNWYTINAVVDDESSTGSGSVSRTPNDGKVYQDETATLTATADDCSVFVGWKLDEDETIVSTDATYTVDPDNYPNWGNHTTHTFKAVFKKKTVNIKVTTADNTKGTVAVVPVTAPAAPQP